MKKQNIVLITVIIVILLSIVLSCCGKVQAQQIISSYEIYQQEEEKVYLGNYQITFYCPCSACCGIWAGGGTASGTIPQSYYTCACGEQIPFGTQIYIDGLGTFVCEDRGVPNGWIDIFVSSHEQALQLGLKYLDCYKIIK